jgi:predicted acylesterase/phospholipase RssA
MSVQMANPVRVQIALQGGGARAAALLAAMEAVQELQEKQIIKVTQIAGTSAGAIIGSLFAADINLKEVKAELYGGQAQQILKTFPEITKWRALFNNFRGIPVCDPQALEDWLEKKFSNAKKRLIKDLTVPTLIVSAELGKSGKHIYGEDDSIVSAVMDSCGFRHAFGLLASVSRK